MRAESASALGGRAVLFCMASDKRDRDLRSVVLSFTLLENMLRARLCSK